jgi:hypothetical protein
MALMSFPSFVGPSYVSLSPIADAERTVNWYVERMESAGAITPTALYPTPVINEIVRTTSVGGRGAYAVDGRAFFVIGADFYELDGLGVVTLIGSVATDGKPAQMTSNGTSGNQLLLASGGTGYVYNLSSGLWSPSVVTSINLVGMVDGFFLGLDSNTGTLKLSDSLNGLVWDPTQVAQRSAASDPWVSMCINNRMICLWGDQSGEFWRNAGTSPFPLALASGSNFGVGIAAIYSAASLNGSIYWLGQTSQGSSSVYMLQGYTPVSISTNAVEAAFSKFKVIEDAEAVTYQWGGHLFYILNFPSENATWCYDASTNLWHELGTWNSAADRYDVWHPQSHIYCFDKHLVVDRFTGIIGELTQESGYEIDGTETRRLRRSPALVKNLERVSYPLFQLLLEPGLGNAKGAGSDPQVMLRQSNDGGKTWGSQRSRSAGKLGEYGTRVRWLRCGSARDRVWEITVTDPIPWRVLGSFIEAA